MSAPLTLGTAGHVDHGKTALVRALTGAETDRLPEERERGISIVLGYARLELPSGRRLSLVDVPGHERFVRTMVAGASGIDAYLMTIAADDGVMPQTREHAAVLRGLGVERGVVAITKADLMAPELALEEAAELLPGVPAVAVSARTGQGIDELRAALDTLAARLPSRAGAPGPALMHLDRVFTIHGVGTVVTGTLAQGSIGRGDTLRLLPGGLVARVRGVHVHDEPVDRAQAGQRVAVNLTGVDRDEAARGDVLVGDDSSVEPALVLDVDVEADVPLDRLRVHVHHGTRESPARVRRLGSGLHRMRLERPLMAVPGDRVIVRFVSPPGTVGGAIVAAAHPTPAVPRLRPAPAVPAAAPRAPAEPPVPAAELDALERRLREAGHTPPLNSELDERALAALREQGRAVRVGRTLHFHPEVVAEVEAIVRSIIDREGEITVARLRDELGTSRKFARALMEHFDAARVTLRRPDDSRVLRGSRRVSPANM